MPLLDWVRRRGGRWRAGARRRFADVGDEAVAAAGDGLDEALALRVAEGAADGGDLGGEVVFLDDGAGPDRGHDLGLGRHPAVVAYEVDQRVQGAGAELYRDAVAQ